VADPLLTILVTGAGAPGIRGTLFALRHAPENAQIRIVGTDAKDDVVGRFMVDAFYRVPAPETEGYLARMLEICAQESVRLVLPQTTREIAFLSQHKNDFAAANVAVVVADAQAIEVANNKFLLLQAFEELGLPYPAYVLARDEAELVAACTRLGYPDCPVVVKPPVSNGMRGLRIVTETVWTVSRFLDEKPSGTEISLAELLRILRNGPVWPQLIVCEYLPGSEYSVDAFIGSRLAVALPRLRRSIRSGISFENVMEYRDDLVQATLRAAAHIGLRYAFGFQFKLDAAGTPKVLECNPRVQGTMVASVFSGTNVIAYALREALGEPPEVTAPVSPTAAEFYRFWGGLGIVDDVPIEI
jgi:carbamoyl-phosphate synthase large subunit